MAEHFDDIIVGYDAWLSQQLEQMVDAAAVIEKLINNNNSKFIQFVNPAAEDETILFIRTKSGNVAMLYLNVLERK